MFPSPDFKKSRFLLLKTSISIIFVVHFMIILNALANTCDKMLTNHHPLLNYVYLDG